MSRRTSSTRQGYTLIELLVVMSIISVLIGLTLAGVQRARANAQRAACMNNMKNQGLAVMNFESAHGALPPGALQGPFPAFGVPDGASHGLWVVLLGYLDQDAVAARYRLDLSFDHPGNQPAARAIIKVLQCPAEPPGRVEQWEPASNYAGIADYGPLEVNPFLADIAMIDPVDNFEGPLPVNGRVRIPEITDGTSQTILLSEAGSGGGTAWCSSTNLLSVRTLFAGSSAHRGGANVCLADGSVRFLRSSLSTRVLAALATRAGGEVIGEDY
jgi:prepilin-type N-terminal cleavage/methylation domain-containing protein/prepilin-type processing-associated H-X9-DG protein